MGKRRQIMINQVIDGVTFQNLPALLDAQGVISYSVNSWAVAEMIAKKIDTSVKPHVAVDFSTVDVQQFLPELNNGQTFSSESDPEKHILDYAFDRDGI